MHNDADSYITLITRLGFLPPKESSSTNPGSTDSPETSTDTDATALSTSSEQPGVLEKQGQLPTELGPGLDLISPEEGQAVKQEEQGVGEASRPVRKLLVGVTATPYRADNARWAKGRDVALRSVIAWACDEASGFLLHVRF